MWQLGICAPILSLWDNKDGGRILGGGNDTHLLHMITSLEKPRMLILVLISIGLASEAMEPRSNMPGHLQDSVSSSVKWPLVTNVTLNTR